MRKISTRLLAAVALTVAVIGFAPTAASATYPNPAPPSCVAGNFTYLNSDTLVTNQELTFNQYTMSVNGNFLLLFQANHDLVLFGRGCQQIWHSNTAGTTGNRVVLQPDGNWVMYNGGNYPAIWATGTDGRGSGNDRVVVQDDGNLVLYHQNGGVIWESHTNQSVPNFIAKGTDTLLVNQSLTPQTEYLRSSVNTGRYYFVLLTDGNLVLYGPAYRVLWYSGTNGTNATHLDMQPDGNLVLYNSSGTAVWSTNTHCISGGHLAVQEDGNVVLYNVCGAAWSTGTAGQI